MMDKTGGKMADILRDDVQTYVRELILKEFESINHEDIAFSGNRKLNESEHQNSAKATRMKLFKR